MKRFFSLLLFCLLAYGISVGVAQAQDKTFKNSSGMEFVLIPAGKFTRSWTVRNDFGENVQHQQVVTISKPFYLGKYEVTQEQWHAVMGDNPSVFKGRSKPVEWVSWGDVRSFIKNLNQKEGGNKYRLPTEAEWEQAARAGSDTAFFFGDDPAALDDYAWVAKNSLSTTHPVGEKKPNPWGLYDIYGNVREWVFDLAGEYQTEAATDPTGPASGFKRLSRGGSYNFNNAAEHCASSRRDISPSGYRSKAIGFRLAFSPEN